MRFLIILLSCFTSFNSYALSSEERNALKEGLQTSVGTCIDDLTCISKAFLNNNDVVNYFYTIKTHHQDLSHLSLADIANHLDAQTGHTVNTWCTHPQVKIILDAGLSISYTYLSSDGSYIYRYQFDKSFCKV